MTLRNKFNLYRRYLNWHKAGCIFIHVPKAAGTSINHGLYGRTLGHYTIDEIDNNFPRLVEKCFVFSIVRNPYDRLVSAYHFAKKGRTKDMGMNNPKQYQIPEFETFERFVYEWLVEQDVYKIDHVFRPQHIYICKEDRLAVDFLGRVETIDEDVCTISKKLGWKLSIEQKNANKNSKNYRDYYSSDLVDTVYQLYSKDFYVLNYDKRL